MNDNTSDKTVDTTQKLTEFKPSAKQRKFLTTALDPKNIYLSGTALCEKAGVSRTAVFKWKKIPEFVNWYEKELDRTMHLKVGQVLNAFLRDAVNGSYQQQKDVLVHCGVISGVKEINHSGSVESTVQFVDDFGEEGETDERNSED